ncbi:glutathione S-transferase family protein [Shimia sediminis]|uniref:glutathione S-transferase family protein n=1 Tax=Shimia sediminis TaxID=2497945 RepID=UPI000F8C617F|nr:glutathione S-transferase family protein [Shimia sediminis]
MKITLHHAHEARSFRVLWLLEEMGLDYELVVHNFFDKSLRSPDYLEINPAARVPALEIDGKVIVESGASVEYLCEIFPEKGLGRPAGDAERMEYLDMLHYAESIGQHMANLTQAHIVLYKPEMRSPTQMNLEARRLHKVLGRLERQLSDGRDYLLASGFSGADCAVGYGVEVAKRFVSFGDLPHCAAYGARIAARPAYQRSLPPEDVQRIYTKDFYEAPDV